MGRLRRWPAVVALACLVGLGADTALALANTYMPFDPPLTREIQAVDWGALAPTFAFFSWLAGLKQFALAVGAIILVFLVNRRATWMMAAGALTGIGYQGMNLLIHRPRPDAHLVHVLGGTQQGYGYPSGHAAFFLAFSILLLYSLGGRVPSRGLLIAGWLGVVLLVAWVCVARIDVGAHWPSDVFGGLCLGGFLVASAFAIRRLSDPVVEQWRAGRRAPD